MSLTKYELLKIFKTPVTTIAIAVVLLLNLYMLLLGSQNGNYCANESPFQTDIERLKQDGAYFAGAITDEWYQSYRTEIEDVINNPLNHVSESEKEKIRQELKVKYSDEAIANMGNFIYVKESIIRSNEYQKYEPMEFASHFYERATQVGFSVADGYRERYPGVKGETLAAKTEEMYGHLAQDYTANYNYDYGYWKLRNMHTTYPFTIGLIILIALAPIFASEYSGKTDALLLTSKHGKRRLIYAKLKAGLLFALLSWVAIELINTLLIFSIYGTTGAEAYWQNWMLDWSPFVFNQLQITLVTIATSLLGAVFMAGIVMLISVLSKNQFVSLLIGGVMLLLPVLSFALTDYEAVQTIFNFMPTRILTAINEWQWFDLAYLFGKAIPVQYVIIVMAAFLLTISMFFSFFTFKRHQVEN
jgi:ABC-type transport system involved in multi-copper enzyme maturation permease subunit